ncbi:MAG: ACP S-malonyltransferase [Bdellovibrionaceae bacterium]|nr:ACP S-malonyltransferase [Pseudobdellovibrionaceae bacterium]
MYVALFPGQGSQASGMGKFLFSEFQKAREVFEEASEAISFDLKKLCFDGSDSDLQLTENTQPALLVTSIATYRVVHHEYGLTPLASAGHSIGEYAALVASGVISLSHATQAVRRRGQAMQAAVPVGQGGMMATLGLDENQARWLCDWAKKESGFGPLSPANFNCPGQIVISGNTKTLDWLRLNLKPEEIPGAPRRVKLIPLSVSAPFHCEMMAPAEAVMREVLTGIPFAKGLFPIVQNFQADFEEDPQKLRENLIRQVSAPVLWTQSLETIKKKGLFQFIEFGHGQVLKGLLKKIDSENFQVWTTSSLDEVRALESHLKASGH